MIEETELRARLTELLVIINSQASFDHAAQRYVRDEIQRKCATAPIVCLLDDLRLAVRYVRFDLDATNSDNERLRNMRRKRPKKREDDPEGV